MTYGRKFWQSLTAVALGALITCSASAQTVVTRLVVAGGAANSVTIQPGDSTSMDVRLDITGAANIYGTGFRLTQLTPATNGFFTITGRSFAGSPFDDTFSGTKDGSLVVVPAGPNQCLAPPCPGVLIAPSPLLDPVNDDNLGRTTLGLQSIPAALNVLAVNLTLTASGTTPLGVYTIGPPPVVSFATGNNAAPPPAFLDYPMNGQTPFTIIVGRPLTVTKNGTGIGTVTADSGAINCGATCSDVYPGTMVTLTAAPNVGSFFVGWSGSGCSGTGTCVVTVDAAKSVNAQFDLGVPLTFALNVTKSGTGAGTVTSAPAGISCGATCSANFNTGTLVTLTPSPAIGSVFVSWSGACAGSGACVVTMDAAKAVNAQFDIGVPVTFALNVTKSGSGAGTLTSAPAGISCGATCSANFNTGTLVTLTPSPAIGSVFTSWSGACAGSGACVVTMDAAKAVDAVFSLQTFALTTTKSGTGTGTLTSAPAGINCGATCVFSFNAGTLVTLTPTPSPGSVFVNWSGACVGSGACVVTMDAAKAVNAVFALQTFALNVNKAGNGTGTVTSDVGGINCGATCSVSYAPGTVVTLTAAPGVGQTFTGWAGGGCGGIGTCVVTVNAVTTVTATFTDSTPPDTTIDSGPTDPSNDPTPTFTFSSSEPGSTFQCSLDGAPFTPCTSPRTVVVDNGAHTFQVFAIDAGGNPDPTPASFSWTAAGIVPPVTAIPTLSEWMLALLALLIGSFGVAARRRRS